MNPGVEWGYTSERHRNLGCPGTLGCFLPFPSGSVSSPTSLLSSLVGSWMGATERMQSRHSREVTISKQITWLQEVLLYHFVSGFFFFLLIKKMFLIKMWYIAIAKKTLSNMEVHRRKLSYFSHISSSLPPGPEVSTVGYRSSQPVLNTLIYACLFTLQISNLRFFLFVF